MSSSPCNGNKTAVHGPQVREQKREKWEAKQERLRKKQYCDSDDQDTRQQHWVEQHSPFAHVITINEARQLLPLVDGETVRDLDAVIDCYRNLKEQRGKNGSRGETIFIAEGTETVRLLLQQVYIPNRLCPILPLQIKSIFVKPSVLLDRPVLLANDVEKALEAVRIDKTNAAHVHAESKSVSFHVLIGTEDVQSAVAGFTISRGALACGVIPQRTEDWFFREYCPLLRQQCRNNDEFSLRLLALDGISDTANLGAMIRCASVFGLHAILLSHDCCDPWYRQSIRVSMGHVFAIPCVRVKDLADTLKQLSSSASSSSMSCADYWSCQMLVYAAVVETSADLILGQLEQGSVPKSWCCVMGNEANGVSQRVRDACKHKLRINMEVGVDSLSVPIATGILLHGLREKMVKIDKE